MFTGREALFSIEQGISRIRSDESRLDAALSSAISEAARLRRDEAEAFRALARVKLDTMVRDHIITDLDATERRALAMIEDHRREMEDLARRRDSSQAALDQAEATKHDRDQDLANALESLDELRRRTAEGLTAASDWQAAKAAVDAAAKIAENADQKASRAEADLAAKGKPYEDDPLFMYLWSRKHGQAEDTSSNFVRAIDRKVARLVGYSDARASYAMLKEIPLRLREHAKNKQADVETAKGHVAEIERQALVADGIESIEARVTAARTAMKTAQDAVSKITDELRQIEAHRQKVLEPGDEAVYGRAVDLLSAALAREDMRELYQEALRTATKADDQAISSITSVRTALGKADGEVAQIRSEIRETARRRAELEGARDRARAVGYEDPRGTFGSDGKEIIGQVIGGILSGVLQGGALDRVLRDSHRSPQGRSGADVGGTWSAPSWPSPWSEGSAGGSSGRGKSGDDDSGWRTGGSF
jgi:chromosome segregation ATPase